MNRLFLDTSVIVAAIDRADRRHERARQIFADHRQTHKPVIHMGIALEVVTVVRRVATHHEAAGWGRGLWNSNMEILDFEHREWNRAMDFFHAFPGLQLSCVDALSFALMERFRVDLAASFDRDFRVVLGEARVIGE